MAKQSSTVLVAIGVVLLVHFAAIPSVDGSRRINSPAEPSISPVPACGNGDGGSCSASCEKPLKDCDFYFQGHEDEVPKIKLIKKGDNNIYVHCGHIVHKTGSQVLKIQTVNSAHCELLKDGSWNKHACHHRLYGNGRHIASREFNIGNPGDFLNTCVKVQISAAQYEGGANFNNGHNNPRACILVKTEGSFEACTGSNCNPSPSPPPPSCTGSDCNSPPPCLGTDCKPPSPPSPPSCTGSDCNPPPSPQPCDGSDCEQPSPPSPPSCTGSDCEQPSPPSPPSCTGSDCESSSLIPGCNGSDCKPPSPTLVPCNGSDCAESSGSPPCQGTDCKPPTPPSPPSPPSCSGSDCTTPPPPPPCDGDDDCQSPAKPSTPSSPSDCGNGGGSCSVSCDKPLKDCDFYFHGHESDVPKVTLIKKGDNNIYVDCGHILHRDGYDTRPVQTVNSAHCELLKGGSWNKHACHHRLYGNGRYVASREFNVGKPTDFLNTCIKVQISAAQYMDGGNFNNGHSNPRACILVKTEGSFK